MSSKLIAFHGQTSIKRKYLNRVRLHAKADEIINGQYWENGKGCAVGCTIHSDSHARYETELGIPEVLARLEDQLFERLFKIDATKAKAWPERFLSSIKTGADLSLVWPKWALFILTDEKLGVLQYAKREQTKASIEAVAALYRRWIETVLKPDASEWYGARAAAAAAAAAAGDDAAAADAAVAAAAAAADAAGAAAADAAAAAAADAAAAAARRRFFAHHGYWPRWWAGYYSDSPKSRARYVAIADKLIELLKEAK